ncbi:hypothetical protein NBRC116583_05510 [Arenicella sp. 4NH20-0111]
MTKAMTKPTIPNKAGAACRDIECPPVGLPFEVSGIGQTNSVIILRLGESVHFKGELTRQI